MNNINDFLISDLSVSFLKFLASDYNSQFEKKDYHIELKPAKLPDKFLKLYSIYAPDSLCNIYIEGKKMSDTLYRYTGITSNVRNINSQKYVLLFKCVPAVYSDEEIKEFGDYGCKHIKRNYLKETWVVIDTETGKETDLEFDRFKSPYIYKNIVTCDNDLYFIPTGKLIISKGYGSVIQTEEHMIVSTKCDKKAVILNKLTGEISEIN